MKTFEEIIDTYILNYSMYNDGYICFDCEFGELTFHKFDSSILSVSGIYVSPKYRQKGFCRSILLYLIDKGKEERKRFKCIYLSPIPLSTIISRNIESFK